MRSSSINSALVLISLALFSQVALCTFANGTSTVTTTATATVFLGSECTPITTSKPRINGEFTITERICAFFVVQFTIFLLNLTLFVGEVFKLAGPYLEAASVEWSPDGGPISSSLACSPNTSSSSFFASCGLAGWSLSDQGPGEESAVTV